MYLNLKQLRKDSKYKQSEIANLLQVNTRTYQRYEAGEYEPNIQQLIQLADLFDVSIDFLVGRTDNPKRL